MKQLLFSHRGMTGERGHPGGGDGHFNSDVPHGDVVRDGVLGQADHVLGGEIRLSAADLIFVSGCITSNVALWCPDELRSLRR